MNAWHQRSMGNQPCKLKRMTRAGRMEREWSNHAARFRTHILVCLGSATIMLLSIYDFAQFVDETNVRVDPSPLAAQVVSGIGFLGAGVILRNGNIIKGLTLPHRFGW